MRSKLVSFVWVLPLVVVLIAVRAFEDDLFYDPFLLFFKGSFEDLPLPYFEGWHLFLGLFFRYTLNSCLSLIIFYVLFKQKEYIQFSAVLYLLFFVFFTTLFFVVLYFFKENNTLLLFYIRRFLIQPLLLLLFVPAFYYQQQTEKKD